jgi:hypothetical protein
VAARLITTPFVLDFAASSVAAVAIAALAIALGPVLLGAQAPVPGPSYDAQGNLRQPGDFSWREWVHIGTPLTPNSLNPPVAPFPEFHSVYIRPSDFQHYARTGAFRDGTILIKELVSVGATRDFVFVSYYPVLRAARL